MVNGLYIVYVVYLFMLPMNIKTAPFHFKCVVGVFVWMNSQNVII